MTRLDHAPLCSMLQKYEDHLRVCATLVTAGQGNINRMVRETDTTLAEITTKMVDRQKKYEKHAEKSTRVYSYLNSRIENTGLQGFEPFLYFVLLSFLGFLKTSNF